MKPDQSYTQTIFGITRRATVYDREMRSFIQAVSFQIFVILANGNFEIESFK